MNGNDIKAMVIGAMVLPIVLLVGHALIPSEFQIVLDSTKYEPATDQWDVAGRAIWGAEGNIRSHYFTSPLWWKSDFDVILTGVGDQLTIDGVEHALDRASLWRGRVLEVSGLGLLLHLLSWGIVGALLGLCVRRVVRRCCT